VYRVYSRNKTGGRRKFFNLVPVRHVEGAGVKHLLKPFFGVKPFITTDTGECWLYLDFDELLENVESMRKLK
jgi:hypothetical protein